MWVLFEEEFDVFDAGRTISIKIFHLLDLKSHCFWFRALGSPLKVIFESELYPSDWGTNVTGGDESFKPEFVEVGGEILEEIALEGVVAIAVDDLTTKSVGVEFEVGIDLFLDVEILRVEFVLLGRPGSAEASVQRLTFHGGICFCGFF